MPPVTVACACILLVTRTVMIASKSVELCGVLDRDNGIMIPVDSTRGLAGFATVLQQQPPSQIGPQDRLPVSTQVYYANYALGLSQVSFPFSQLSLPPK